MGPEDYHALVVMQLVMKLTQMVKLLFVIVAMVLAKYFVAIAMVLGNAGHAMEVGKYHANSLL
jgi:hypothetical protein